MKDIDWRQRKQELIQICKEHRGSGNYDCIIGVSGGKDSTRQVLYVKEELQLHPLLVSLTYPPEQQTERGAKNISNMINLGFDTITISPSPLTWKKLLKKGFYKYGNWGRSTELSLFSTVPRLATAYQIPLIIWGENPALTLGELGTGKENLGGTASTTKLGYTLAEGNYQWLLGEGVEKQHILQYRYPSNQDMKRANIFFVYLGYFWDRWSQLDNGLFSALNGLSVRKEAPQNIGDILGVSALDDDWVVLNQMIKYLKFGFGKVTDTVCEHMRFFGMDRDMAINLVNRYDGTCSDENIQSFCQYLEITENEFWKIVDSYVNKDLFRRGEIKRWEPKFKVR